MELMTALQIGAVGLGCSGCGNGNFVNEIDMNGSFKRPFKVQFFDSWTSKGKLEILYLGHQWKKHTNKK